MTAFLPYLLKVILCSALLVGYYYLALRNKLFHQWNRFYLLATVILSLLIPCFSFTISHTPIEAQSRVIQVLQVVSASGPYEGELPTVTVSFWKSYGAVLVYAFVSTVLLIGMLLSILKVYRLVQSHTVQQQGKLRLILTTAKGTPFSFFQFLFWNPSIDMTSEAGHQIFKHELVHIEEKHTVDKLFMQLALIVCWINPVFWLIRYELRMVHEFIADRKAVGSQDASTLAAMILQAAYPQHFSQLTNSFFHQSIKRRLHMLTKIQNPERNYISRILLLPLMAILTLAFTVRTELTEATTYVKAAKKMALQFNPINEVGANKDNTNMYSSAHEKDSAGVIKDQALPVIKYTGEKKIKVVIDAGHGGHDNGAGSNEVFEKDIALAIAKEVQELNSNTNIEIIMTRESDKYVKLHDRADFVAKQQADLFISVHVGAAPPIQTEAGTIENPHRGFDVFIPRDSTLSYFEQSKVLGSAVLHQLNTVKAVPARMQLLQRNVGIWVLNQNACPSILIECGYISNTKDRTYLLQKENQQHVARKLLAGIEVYLQAANQTPLPVKKNNVDAGYISNVMADNIQPIEVKYGASFTAAQLQAIPFEKLFQPDTEYTMGSAYFSITQSDNDNTAVQVLGTSMPNRVKQLIDAAKSGDRITIHSRTALTKDNKVINLPNLVYFIQ
jgi:N-acetylmuramoyl-L-alanine amidase